MEIFSFPAIANEQSQVLILGTMPGKKSLSMNQYYAHGGNQFWKILFRLFNEPISFDYKLRCDLLFKNKIALWDVLKVCIREGSSDSAIAEEMPNDFKYFLDNHPSIRLIAFNGQNPNDYFQIYSKDLLKVPSITLPSTSPANTWKKFDDKLNEWKQILNFIS